MRTSTKVLAAMLVLVPCTAFAANPPAAAPAPAQPAQPAQPQTAQPATTGAPADTNAGAQPAQSAAAPPAVAPPTPEAVAEAARQTELARQAFKAKRFTQAAQLFEAAAALSRQPGAHASAAQSWDQADRPERAADAYARAISAGDSDASAKDRLDALERSLGTVDVKAPAGWSVQLDSGTEALAPARLHGVAGIHSLAIAAPDRAIARRDVRLEPGKPLALVLKDEPVQNTHTSPHAPNESTAPQPASDGAHDAAPAQHNPVVVEKAPPGQTRRSIGFALAGFGVASLGATILLGLETINARNAYNQAPTHPLYDHEQTLQLATNVTLIGGAVLLAGGVVLVLWPSSSAATTDVTVGLAPTPGGGALVGKF